MTYDDKVALFKTGKYLFEVPPVPHIMWTLSDWIRYIDTCGEWRS